MRKFTDLTDFVRLKQSYREVFGTALGKKVLADLAKSCHAASTTADPDPREQSRKEGKRQIWLRIQNMIHLPDEEIFNLEKENQ